MVGEGGDWEVIAKIILVGNLIQSTKKGGGYREVPEGKREKFKFADSLAKALNRGATVGRQRWGAGRSVRAQNAGKRAGKVRGALKRVGQADACRSEGMESLVFWQ